MRVDDFGLRARVDNLDRDQAQAQGTSSGEPALKTAADSSTTAAVGNFNADELYFQAWLSVINRCKRELDNTQLAEALTVTSLPGFRARLEALQADHQSILQNEVLFMLYLTLSHYEQFAAVFVKMMKKEDVNTSMMWGLLYLVVKLSMFSKDSLDRIHKLLKAIGSSLDSLTEISDTTPAEKMKEDSVEVHNNIIGLWLNIILLFRDNPGKIQERNWKSIQQTSDTIVKIIKDAVERYLTNSQIILTKKQQKDMELQLMHFQPVTTQLERLSLDPTILPNGRSTCHKLPAVSNPHFFGRVTEIKKIENLLKIDQEPFPSGFPSVVLHGLAGIGKSQISLEFAYKHTEKFPVILWFNSETEISMQASFSSAAVDWLRLANAVPNQDLENRVILLKWLQETETNCLLVYDNLENNEILNRYLPVLPRKIALIITSRKRIFKWNREALEVTEFSPDTSVKFISHLLKGRFLSEIDLDIALKLSKHLQGHPLAINQMIALMDNKRWSFTKFLRKFESSRPKLLKDIRTEWSHGGYSHLLGNLFSMSFQELMLDSRHLLGVLSFISADIIPLNLFMVREDFELPDRLQFCQDEDSLDDVVNPLINFALIKMNPADETINIHRLVQDEFKSQLSKSDHQETFDAASLLLYEAFPKQVNGAMFNDRMPVCARYIQHVFCLRDSLETVMKEDKRLKRSPTIVPSPEYVKLMTNAAWYCVERQDHAELEVVLENSFQAMELNKMKDTEPLIWAHLCNSAGRLWGQRGYFAKGEIYFDECLKIRRMELRRGDENIAGVLSNLGNLYLSMANYEKALDFQKQSLDFGVVGDENLISKRGQSIIKANMARVLTDMGRTEEASVAFNESDALIPNKDSPYRRFYKCRLLLKQGRLEDAKESLKICQGDIIAGEGPGSVLLAACAYRLGCIALSESNYKEAILYFTKSRAIIERRQAPDCTKARVLYALWKARSLAGFENDEQKNEFEEMLKQAQKLRKQLSGKGEDENDSEEAYDLLVDCQLR